MAASALADQTIAAAQGLAAELRPGALDHLGLTEALAQRNRQFRWRSGLTCTLDVAEPLPALPPAEKSACFAGLHSTTQLRHAGTIVMRSFTASWSGFSRRLMLSGAGRVHRGTTA